MIPVLLQGQVIELATLWPQLPPEMKQRVLALCEEHDFSPEFVIQLTVTPTGRLDFLPSYPPGGYSVN